MFKRTGDESRVVSRLKKLRPAEASNGEYAALEIGEKLIAKTAERFGMTTLEAQRLLSSDGAIEPDETLSAMAAEGLIRMKEAGELPGEIEDYLANENFIEFISHMPVEYAIRLIDAEKRLKSERETGSRDTLEKLASRRALPFSMRTKAPVSAEMDFMNMDQSAFDDFKRQLARERRMS